MNIMTSKSEVPGEDIPFSEHLRDERLLNAVTNAVNSQTMTPLIKEELRCTILSRRHAEGKGEIKIEQIKPSPKKIYTEQEKQRKLRRQEQNRRAAQRCRQKKKEQENTVLKDYYEQKDIQNQLYEDIETLKKEREQLQKLLGSHLKVCTLNHRLEAPGQEPTDIQSTSESISSYNCQIEVSPSTDEDPFYNGSTSDMSDVLPDYDHFTTTNFADYNDNVDAVDDSPVFFDEQSSGNTSSFILDNRMPYFIDRSADNNQYRRRHVSESSYFSEADTDIIDEPIYSDVHNIPNQWDAVKQDVFQETHPETVKQVNTRPRDCRESLTSEYDCDIDDRLFNKVPSFLHLLTESEMDMRQNGEERGASCSSLEELDNMNTADIMQFLNHDIENGNVLCLPDDPDQSVFVDN